MINEELLQRLSIVSCMGFDVDDLLVKRDDNTFHRKLEYVLLAREHTSELQTIADTYRALIITNFVQPLTDPLRGRLDQIRSDQNIQLQIDTIVKSHHDDAIRNRAVLKLAGIDNPDDFWDFYGKFSQAAQERELPANLLVIPSEGSINLLQVLRDRKISVFVFTNSPIERALKRLHVFPLETFDQSCIFSAHEFKIPNSEIRKPNSLGLKLALQTLDVSPESAAYLGNGTHDIQAAFGAEMLPVLVLPTDIQVTNELPPHLRVSSLSEFHEMIT